MPRKPSARKSAVALAALVFATGPTPQVGAQGDANQIVPLNAYKDLKWRSVGAWRTIVRPPNRAARAATATQTSMTRSFPGCRDAQKAA